MSPDFFLRQTFGDPKEEEAVYDGMIDRGRGGRRGVRWESFILAKGPVFKPWLYLRFFVVVVFFFFFSCQEGALCPAQSLQLLKRGAVVNTATVDEE